jgi:hypothetical protein
MKIEKGIAPEPFNGRINYPFAEMEPGDSILIDASSGWEVQKKAQTAAYIHAKRHSRKFMSRMQEDGLRIWRVK